MPRKRDRAWLDGRSPEDGVVSIEVLAYAGLMLTLALAVLQVSAAGSSAVAARVGARAASRASALGASPAEVQAAATAAVPPNLRPSLIVATDGTRVTVAVRIPVVLPGFEDGPAWTVRRTAEMPPERR